MNTQTEILRYLREHPKASRSAIENGIAPKISRATMQRFLNELIQTSKIQTIGTGRATRYQLTIEAQITLPIDLETYFALETDERHIQTHFNFDLMPHLKNIVLFTEEEAQKLEVAQKVFRHNLWELSKTQYRKEMERLGIDLSWKSAQIEGNTYSLLETERLLKEKEAARGKTREEAVMLLNHKKALDYILDKPDDFKQLSILHIEEIHALLMEDFGVERNIRQRRVGITGTNYQPLDNAFQIREALEDAVLLVNSKENVFEKALLTLALLSYIQAFVDGNKRTARIASNAVLIANGYCPLSFRSVDSIDYKKATLIFYEQNNLSALKEIFIEQFLFAVQTYF